MKLLTFYVCLLLFITCTLTLTTSHKKQSVLRSSKAARQPLVINLNKRERSAHEKKQIVSFIQKATNDIKSASLLQEDASTKDFRTATKSVKLPLLNTMNTQYSGVIAIGSNKQPFDIIFDTGSTALFVNSDLCTDDACLTHDQFDPFSSTSLAVTDPLMGLEVEYGSGAVEGVLVQEDLYIGDVKVEDFIMFLISEQAGVLDDAAFDGVAGLSFTENAEDGGPQIISFFDAMVDQLPQPYFSMHLRRNDEKNSYVMFGGYNEDHMDSELIWHKVIDPHYWMIELTNIVVGGKETQFCKKFKCGVVIDSGTSVLTAPTFAISEMQSLIGAVKCHELSKLPDVTFELGNQKYTMAPEEYVITVDSDNNAHFFEHSDDVASCSGTFTPMDMQTADGTVIFIFGDTFMTKYLTVFDTKEKRIGMALQKR